MDNGFTLFLAEHDKQIPFPAPIINFSPANLTQSSTKKNYPKTREKVFGAISRECNYENVYVCDENISGDVVRVFWNKDSGEIVKLLGNTIYAHYNVEDKSVINDHILTIPDNIFIEEGYASKPDNHFLSANYDHTGHANYESDEDVAFSDETSEVVTILKTGITRFPPPPAIPQITFNEPIVKTYQDPTFLSGSTDADASLYEYDDNKTTISPPVKTKTQSTIPSPQREFRSQSSTNPSYSAYVKQHKAGALRSKWDYTELLSQIEVLQQENAQLRNNIYELTSNYNSLKAREVLYRTKTDELSKSLKISQDKSEYFQKLSTNYKLQLDNATNDIQKLTTMLNSYEGRSKMPCFDAIVYYFDNVDKEETTVTELGWQILKEMFINAHAKSKARQYSVNTKKFFWVINSQSSIAFATLREVLPLPCFNTLHSIARSFVIETECSLLDVKFIASFTSSYIRKYTKGTIAATLAIDAIVVTPKNIEKIKSDLRGISPSLLKAFNSQIKFVESVTMEPVNNVFDSERTSSTQQTSEQEVQSDEVHSSSQTLDFKKEVLNTNTKDLNNVFIFYIEPLNPNVPCFPVHVWFQSGGSANEVVRSLTDHVIIQVEKSQACIIKQISTDGDLGHQPAYTAAMKTLLELSKKLDINEICQGLRAYPSLKLASADMLHFLKTFRIKVLLHILSLFPYNTNTTFDIKTFSQLFGDGKEITDLSHIGKMRDVYPLKMFSLKNLIALKKEGSWSGVLVFLPWCLWLSAALNTAFTLRTRMLMLKICFEFCKRFYNIVLTKRKWEPTIGEIAGPSKEFLTFLSQSVLERLIPTLAVFISSLSNYIEIKELLEKSKSKHDEAHNEQDVERQKLLINEGNRLHKQAVDIGRMFGFPDDIDLDLAFRDLGTHPLENFNGNIRDTAHNNDTITTTPHIIARAHVQKCFKNELHIKNAKRSRINIGGIKLSQSRDICDAPDIDEVIFTETLFYRALAANNETVLCGKLDGRTVETFFEFLEESAEKTESLKTMPDLSTPNSVRNSAIDNRYYGYA